MFRGLRANCSSYAPLLLGRSQTPSSKELSQFTCRTDTVEKQNRVDPIDLRTIARLGTVLRRERAHVVCSRISVGGNYSTPLRLIALID